MNIQQNSQVSQRAFDLWERNGKPNGQDLDHWLQAERELLKKETPAKKAAAKKPLKAAAKSPLTATAKTAKTTTRAKKKT